MNMTKEQLLAITERIKEKVWRNPDVMFCTCTDDAYQNAIDDALDILSSLHNLLYEEVTGERYDYAFHWTNKIGSDTIDNVFDDILKGGVSPWENGKE